MKIICIIRKVSLTLSNDNKYLDKWIRNMRYI